jgi:hypothetical protein
MAHRKLCAISTNPQAKNVTNPRLEENWYGIGV